MKRVFTILLAALLPAAGSATENRQGPLALPAVIHMLGKGQPVAVTVDLSLCSAVPNDAKPSKTRGGLRINAFRLTDDGTLAFADEHMTIDLDGKPIVQFLRYKVHPDNSAQFSMTVFSLPAYEQKGKTLEFNCAMDRGLSFFPAR
ncbi:MULTISPECIES: VirK family protein [Rhizobium]|uniref:VirK family protein n=1 Tax=Rhizobium rhododendri TaxID=2506430 RepID=A0ABY8ITA2_9HYPH|nr:MULTISPECIES: VirK family protein [Rhizobium]TQX81767.1 hypothetical protein EQW76_28320 [Rhizobium sp. rho-13.1]TQY05236.1 hypothetical protein EQW74_27595 [Rhizobium sp. rho-1.1]WFS26377.1 VirK family protein [Rhizobium rhododendri]